ncbi:hypothetical protein Pelo_12270 [Pelomyxa schiedti]|nr:hypothetical protein Pelo_12270 [Pelomyxa schiedti]
MQALHESLAILSVLKDSSSTKPLLLQIFAPTPPSSASASASASSRTAFGTCIEEQMHRCYVALFKLHRERGDLAVACSHLGDAIGLLATPACVPAYFAGLQESLGKNILKVWRSHRAAGDYGSPGDAVEIKNGEGTRSGDYGIYLLERAAAAFGEALKFEKQSDRRAHLHYKVAYVFAKWSKRAEGKKLQLEKHGMAISNCQLSLSDQGTPMVKYKAHMLLASLHPRFVFSFDTIMAAVSNLKECLSFMELDPFLRAKCLKEIGRLYSTLSLGSESKSFYQQAVELFQCLLATSPNKEKSSLLYEIGETYCFQYLDQGEITYYTLAVDTLMEGTKFCSRKFIDMFVYIKWMLSQIHSFSNTVDEIKQAIAEAMEVMAVCPSDFPFPYLQYLGEYFLKLWTIEDNPTHLQSARDFFFRARAVTDDPEVQFLLQLSVGLLSGALFDFERISQILDSMLESCTTSQDFIYCLCLVKCTDVLLTLAARSSDESSAKSFLRKGLDFFLEGSAIIQSSTELPPFVTLYLLARIRCWTFSNKISAFYIPIHDNMSNLSKICFLGGDPCEVTFTASTNSGAGVCIKFFFEVSSFREQLDVIHTLPPIPLVNYPIQAFVHKPSENWIQQIPDDRPAYREQIHNLNLCVVLPHAGITLATTCSRGCSDTLLLKITEQMLSVVGIFLECRVVHRDLNPETIVVDSNGDIHLSDYGLAIICPTSEMLAPIPTGKPRWGKLPMPPEVDEALCGDIVCWAKADSFAVGTLLDILLHSIPTVITPDNHTSPPTTKAQIQEIVSKLTTGNFGQRSTAHQASQILHM